MAVTITGKKLNHRATGTQPTKTNRQGIVRKSPTLVCKKKARKDSNRKSLPSKTVILPLHQIILFQFLQTNQFTKAMLNTTTFSLFNSQKGCWTQQPFHYLFEYLQERVYFNFTVCVRKLDSVKDDKKLTVIPWNNLFYQREHIKKQWLSKACSCCHI